MNQTFIRATSAAACAVLMAACSAGNPLDVVNLNNPDVARSYGSPGPLDGVIGSTYQQFNNVWNNTSGADVDAKMFSTEGFSTVANFCMNNYAAVPRNPIINQVGGQCDSQQLNDFQGFQELARNTANMIIALDKLTKAGLTTGSAATDARDRGFAFFVNAVSLGELAVMYDSSAITIPSTVPLSTTVPPLSGYAAVGTAALAQLDTAIAIFSAGVASAPTSSMLPTASPITPAGMVQFLHSWKARLRAGVARTPAERAAVDWPSVIADAIAGITADVQITVGGGWSCGYNCSQMYSSLGWHEMTDMTIGMADTSGSYAAFNALPILQRDGSQLLIQTSDLRMPQGATRAAQENDTPITVPFTAGRYIANRPASGDFSGPGFGTSEYDYKRNLAVFKLKAVGNVVQFALAENTMLEAEGYIMTGAFASARPLIDASRALHGLASIGAAATLAVPIAGAAFPNNGPGVPACVPQVPTPGTFTTMSCGNILEAMKWEKRMETAYTAYATWYQDSRGWGDLVAGTALMWPVPNEEMNSRGKHYYSIGGLGQPNAAVLGTYGW